MIFTFSDRAIEKIFIDHEFKVITGRIKNDLIYSGEIDENTVTYPLLTLISNAYNVLTNGEKLKIEEFIVFNSISEFNSKKFISINLSNDKKIIINKASFEIYKEKNEFYVDYERKFKLIKK